MHDFIDPDDLLSEKQVYDKMGHLFADRELREARQAGEIEFFDLRKGPHYSPKQLSDYLASKARRQMRGVACDA